MQGDLFEPPPVPSACDKGWHGPLVDDPPLDYGHAVNVGHRCTRCDRLVSTTSWTKDAWEKRRTR